MVEKSGILQESSPLLSFSDLVLSATNHKVIKARRHRIGWLAVRVSTSHSCCLLILVEFGWMRCGAAQAVWTLQAGESLAVL